MHAKTILAGLLSTEWDFMHFHQVQGLSAAVQAALVGSHLSLSRLALGLKASTTLRHRIKRMDRLLGNKAIERHSFGLYAAVARILLRRLTRPILIMDWSDLTPNQEFQLLRASVVLKGRSITVYEEVHPLKKLNSHEVHRRFLNRLARLLPTGCTPIILTDAGFRAPFFRLVEALNWYCIGRVRNRDLVSIDGQWVRPATVMAKAKLKACSLGTLTYVRSNPFERHFVLARKQSRGRHKTTLRGQRTRSRHSEKNARREREPWLLAVSPALKGYDPEKIVMLYGKRMQIEEEFRDLKNAHLGAGLSLSRSRSPLRFTILLLIGHLAGLIRRMVGEYAKEKNLEAQYQSTNRKSRPEVSVISLGRRLLAAGKLPPWFEPMKALALIQLQLSQVHQ